MVLLIEVIGTSQSCILLLYTDQNYDVGNVNMIKMLVKKYGKAVAESVDSHNTKPIYFAAQEGTTT